MGWIIQFNPAACRRTLRKGSAFPEASYIRPFPEAEPQENVVGVAAGKAEPYRSVRRQAAGVDRMQKLWQVSTTEWSVDAKTLASFVATECLCKNSGMFRRNGVFMQERLHDSHARSRVNAKVLVSFSVGYAKVLA